MTDVYNDINDLYLYTAAFIMIVVIFILIKNPNTLVVTQNYVSNTFIYIILATIFASLLNIIFLLKMKKKYII